MLDDEEPQRSGAAVASRLPAGLINVICVAGIGSSVLTAPVYGAAKMNEENCNRYEHTTDHAVPKRSLMIAKTEKMRQLRCYRHRVAGFDQQRAEVLYFLLSLCASILTMQNIS